MQDHASDVLAAEVGRSLAYGGASGAIVFGGLSLSDWGVIAGVLIGIAGLVIQIYYKRRTDGRDSELHEAEMDDLKRHE